MRSHPLTINKQGLLLIPLKFRKMLNTDSIVIEVEDTTNPKLTIIPAQDVGGVFSDYAQNLESELKIESVTSDQELEGEGASK